MKHLGFLQVALAAALSATSLTPAASAHVYPANGFVVPNKQQCKQERTSGKNLSSPLTIRFKVDCGASGSITIPSISMSGSSDEWGMLTHVCFGPDPIAAQKNACPTSSLDPNGRCTLGNATFWYLMTKFNAIRLNGDGAFHIDFNSNSFPLAFTSNTLILPGYTYGLCVLAPNGSVVQDDFATGNGANPSGNTINLDMVLTQPYLSFDLEESFDLYLVSKPANRLPWHRSLSGSSSR